VEFLSHILAVLLITAIVDVQMSLCGLAFFIVVAAAAAVIIIRELLCNNTSSSLIGTGHL